MKIFSDSQKNIKLIDNKKIFINNYQNIIDYSSEFIHIDQYMIKGENLVIRKIDEISVEIYGKIKKIEISEN